MTPRALLFDLDNCLAAADEIGAAAYQPAFDAIRAVNRGALTEPALDAALADTWHHALDYVARKHGFTDAMLAAAWAAFSRMEAKGPMRGYGDLSVLGDLPGARFLITSGFRRLQASKIKALGIASLFHAIHIDAIDETPRKGKEAIFAEILRSQNLDPREALVIGDNPHSEIEAGNRLGIATVQILRPGVTRSDKAEHHIHNLHDLKRLLSSR